MAQVSILWVFLYVISLASTGKAAPEVSVEKFGAKPGGDIVEGLTKAWREACDAPGDDKIIIPKGNYTAGPILLQGPCKGSIHMEIQGNIKAPDNPSAFKGTDAFVKIEYVDKLTITAKGDGGVFDGDGHIAWKQNNCAQSGTCDALPFNFRLNFITNSEIGGLSSMNSKQFHMNILGCKELTVKDMKIRAPPESLNTDGIHIGRSESVRLSNIDIETGDDCISIGDGTRKLTVEKVTCTRGHGISIGSLGRYQNEEPVVAVLVRDCTLHNTDNGVRVKTWLNSFPAEASDLRFQNIKVENVSNPIIVDQAYCPYNHCKQPTPSKVKLTKISFENIKGTSSTECVIRLACSEGVPCEEVDLNDIELKYMGGGQATSECANVKPKTSGKMVPPACSKPADMDPTD